MTLSRHFFSDNFYERITEETYAGNKRSRLQHEWTFDVPLQGTATFYVEAYHDSSVENFDFDFSVDDGASWTTMLTVTKSADDGQTQSFVLPSSATGEVIVHVVDTDRSRNENSTDTVFIDQMYIETFQALHAADITTGAIEGAAALTPAQLAPAVEQVVAYWAAWGIDSSRLDALSRTQIQIADLGGSLLGIASSSGRVWIDRDAAIGYDLGTVVAHEFGHVLGFDHNDYRDVMAARLLPKASDRIADRRSGELVIDSFWSDALPSPADARYTVLQTRRDDDLKPASVTRLDRRRDAIDSIFANFTGPRLPKDLPARQDSRRRARSEHEFKQSHVEELKLLADTK